MATDNSEDRSASHDAARFATTHWSVVQAAEDSAAPGVAQALEELCRAYWYPLYAYLRRRGYGVEEAQDLTQEFLARLIRKPRLGEANPSKGRFRNFLLTALNNFLTNEWRRSRTARRGGGQAVIPLDDTAEARYAEESVSDLTPERIYEHRWAVSVFDQALRQLRAQYATANKTAHFDCLRKYLSMEAAQGEYNRLGKELEMSPGAVASAVHRLRQHYVQVVRETVAQTVESPAELEEEMRWLLAALR